MALRARVIAAWIGIVVLCGAATVGGHSLIQWLEGALDVRRIDGLAATDSPMFLGLLLLYVVLLALPFVPGAELGIFLMLMFGAAAALPVYGATVLALILSFLTGRLVPLPRLVAALQGLGLGRAAALLLPVTPVAAAVRPVGILARLLRYRCVALGVLFNTPGNAVLGGGGGIALAAGASRLLSFPQFLATAVIAVAPVPAAVLFAAWLK